MDIRAFLKIKPKEVSVDIVSNSEESPDPRTAARQEEYNSLMCLSNVNTNILPSNVGTKTYIRLVDHDRFLRYGNEGIWMLFYNYNSLDEMWKLAKTNYNNGMLNNISTISVVHSGPAIKPDGSPKGCIQFACSNNTAILKLAIKNILTIFPYSDKYVYYKAYNTTSSGNTTASDSTVPLDVNSTETQTYKKKYTWKVQTDKVTNPTLPSHRLILLS